MTPLEEKRAKMREEEAAHKARKQVMNEVLEMALSRMPDGHVKRCGQILLQTGQIHELLCVFDHVAAKTDALDENLSQQVLDYLTCVHVGMTEFIKQIGLEVPDGTP